MSITRRHHYVWRHYLTAWSEDGTIAVSRKNGASFRANPINVGMERDFYRLPNLTAEDVQFVRSYIGQMPNPTLRQLVSGWIEVYCIPETMRQALSKLYDEPAAYEQAIENATIQAEESMHSGLEGDSIDLLNKLRNGEENLWDDEEFAQHFSIFISFQHTRTKKMRDKILEAARSDDEREAFSRRFPVLRAISATAFGWSIFTDRQSWRIRMLRANGRLNFITSDQPTQNLLNPIRDNDLAIYYPVSPKIAVLFEHKSNPSAVSVGDLLDDEAVSHLNRMVVDYSHEQIFGTDNQYLDELHANSRP